MKLHRIIVCRQCRKIDEYDSSKLHLSPIKVGKNLCEECLSKSRKALSLKMKNCNPMHKEGVKKKVSESVKTLHATGVYDNVIRPKHINYQLTDDGKKSLSEKMRNNNPMKRKEVVDKVKETYKRKIQSGEMVYKRGHDHHLYKGNKTFNLDCRKWLKGWIEQNLRRDNYTCTRCQKNKCALHVHHLRPLREIISKILLEEKINNVDQLKKENITEYERLIGIVVKEHSLEDGITLCKECHGEVDERYRRYRKRKELT